MLEYVGVFCNRIAQFKVWSLFKQGFPRYQIISELTEFQLPSRRCKQRDSHYWLRWRKMRPCRICSIIWVKTFHGIFSTVDAHSSYLNRVFLYAIYSILQVLPTAWESESTAGTLKSAGTSMGLTSAICVRKYIKIHKLFYKYNDYIIQHKMQ